MYRLCGTATGGYKLEVVSLGLYSIGNSVQDVVACQDAEWGRQLPQDILMAKRLNQHV